MRKSLRNQNDLPIVLMAPIDIDTWLQFYDKNIENICSEVSIVPNGVLVSNSHHLSRLHLNVFPTNLLKCAFRLTQTYLHRSRSDSVWSHFVLVSFHIAPIRMA